MIKQDSNKEQTTNDIEQVSDKERVIVLLLSWFLGMLGIHRFYVKRKKSAIVMFVLFVAVVGKFIVFLWNPADMIYVLVVLIPFYLVLLIWSGADTVCILIGEFKDGDGLKIKKWLSK